MDHPGRSLTAGSTPRSASPRMALVKVPKTYPACTLLVSSETCVAPMANSALSDGTTAVAENQSVMAAT